MGEAESIGVPFEKTAAMIATISAATRESAETVGTSVKSIYARVESLKEKGFAEEDGTKINAVAKSLSSIGVQLVDAKGNFRNFSDVLDEVGAKWATLDTRHKQYLSTTIAGSYQASRFNVLMSNYAQYLDLANKAMDASGTTQQKYNLYLQGTEAQLNKLKATIEGVWLKMFDSQTMTSSIKAVNDFIISIGDLTKNIGFIPVALGAVTPVLLMFNKGMRESITTMSIFGSAAKGLTITLDGLKTAFRTVLSSTLIGAAIAAVSYGVEQLTTSYFDNKKAQQDLEVQNNKIADNWNNQQGKIQDLLSSYKELSTKMGENNDISKLTSDEQKKYQDVSNQLNQLLPNLTKEVDANGQAHLKSAEAIQKEIEYTEKLAEAKKKVDIDNTKGKVNDNNSDIQSKQRQIDYYQAQLDLGGTYDEVGSFSPFTDEDKHQIELRIQSLQMDIKNFTDDSKVKLNELSGATIGFAEKLSGVKIGDNVKKSITDIIDSSKKIDGSNVDSITKLINQIATIESTIKSGDTSYLPSLMDGLKKSADVAGLSDEQYNKLKDSLFGTSDAAKKTAESIKDLNSIQKEVDSTFSKFVKDNTELSSVYDKIKTGQQLTGKEIADLISKYPELSSAIENQNGVLTLNKKAVEDLMQAKELEFKSGLQSQLTELDNQEKALKSKLQMYDKELQAIESVAQAKDLASKIRMDNINSGNVKSAEDDMIMNGGLEDQFTQLGKIREQRKSLNALMGVSIESLTKEKEAREKTTPAVDEYDTKLKENSLLLDDIKNKLSEYPKWSQQYRDALEKEKTILQQRNALLKEQLDHMDASGKAVSGHKVVQQSGGSTSSVSGKLGGNLAGYESTFIDAAKQYGVDPMLAMAISMHETGNGSNTNYNNVGGMMTSSGKMHFDSIQDGIYAMVSNLARNYIQQGLTSISSIQKKYAPIGADNDPNNQNSDWVNGVSSFYKRLGGNVTVGDNITTGKDAVSDQEYKLKQLEIQKQQSDNQKIIDSIPYEEANSKALEFEHSNELVNTQIDLLQTKMANLDNTSQTYRDNLTEEIKLNQDKQSNLKQEMDYIQGVIDANKDADAEHKITDDGISQLTDKYNKLSGEMEKNKKVLLDLNGQKADSFLQQQRDLIDDIDQKLELSKSKQALYNKGTPEYNTELINQMELMQKKIPMEQEFQQSIKDTLATQELSTEEQKKLNKELDDSIKKQYEDQKAIDSALNQLADDVVNAEKSAYEALKKAATDAIDDQMKAEENRHKNVMTNLDAEMKAKEDEINLQLKAIDQQSSADDYKQQLTDAQKTAQDTQNQINSLSLDDSIEAKAKRVQLSQDLAKQQEAIAKLQSTHEKDLRKQNLQDQLANYKTSIDAQKSAEDTMYNNTKDSLDKQKQAQQDYYDNIINDERKWSDQRQSILNGDFTKVKSSLTSLEGSVHGNMKRIGDNIANSLIKNLQDAVNLMNQLNAMNGGKGVGGGSSSSGGSSTGTNTGSTGSSSSDAYTNQLNYLQSLGDNAWATKQVIAMANITPNQYDYLMEKAKGNDGDAEWAKSQLEAAGIQAFATGGFTGNWSGGGKLAILDQKELVLNQIDTSNILKAVDIVRNFNLPNISSLLSKIIPSQTTNANKTLQINSELVRIDNFVNNSDKDITTLTNQISENLIQRFRQYGFV